MVLALGMVELAIQFTISSDISLSGKIVSRVVKEEAGLVSAIYLAAACGR